MSAREPRERVDGCPTSPVGTLTSPIVPSGRNSRTLDSRQYRKGGGAHEESRGPSLPSSTLVAGEPDRPSCLDGSSESSGSRDLWMGPSSSVFRRAPRRPESMVDSDARQTRHRGHRLIFEPFEFRSGRPRVRWSSASFPRDEGVYLHTKDRPCDHEPVSRRVGCRYVSPTIRTP